MSCAHDNIRVFEEVTYYGRLVDGVVYYDSNKVASVDELSAECMDCDEQFDEIENDEPESGTDDGKPTRDELIDFIDTVMSGNTEYDRLEELAAALIHRERYGTPI